MSEFLNVNLLGIIGTVTGIFALLISYRTYSKQKPNLKVKVTNCEHNLPAIIGFSQHGDMSFWARFQIKNVGDRGTSINDIVLSFKVDGKKYQFHKKYFRGLQVPENRWIDAGQTIDIEADFNEQFDGTEEDQITCTFTIYDTHK
jgi:hypothetical protein